VWEWIIIWGRFGIGREAWRKKCGMKISLFGLGHVGCVYVGCLARAGHGVVGVDIDPHRVGLLNEGRATIVEPGVDVLIREGWEAGRIGATTDGLAGLQDAEVSVICVDTPGGASGSLDGGRVLAVAETGHRGGFGEAPGC